MVCHNSWSKFRIFTPRDQGGNQEAEISYNLFLNVHQNSISQTFISDHFPKLALCENSKSLKASPESFRIASRPWENDSAYKTTYINPLWDRGEIIWKKGIQERRQGESGVHGPPPLTITHMGRDKPFSTLTLMMIYIYIYTYHTYIKHTHI